MSYDQNYQSHTDTQSDHKVCGASVINVVLILILNSSPQPLNVFILEW